MPNPVSNGCMSRRLLSVTAATCGAEQFAETSATPLPALQSLFCCPSRARPALARPDGCHALGLPTPGLLCRCLVRASSGPEARACAAPAMAMQILGKRVGAPLERCVAPAPPPPWEAPRSLLRRALTLWHALPARPAVLSTSRRGPAVQRSCGGRCGGRAPSRWTWSWRPRSQTPTTRTGRCLRSWMRRRPPSGRGPSRRRRLCWCRRCGPAAGRTAARRACCPRALLPLCRPSAVQACRGECAAGAALLQGVAQGGSRTKCWQELRLVPGVRACPLAALLMESPPRAGAAPLRERARPACCSQATLRSTPAPGPIPLAQDPAPHPLPHAATPRRPPARPGREAREAAWQQRAAGPQRTRVFGQGDRHCARRAPGHLDRRRRHEPAVRPRPLGSLAQRAAQDACRMALLADRLARIMAAMRRCNSKQWQTLLGEESEGRHIGRRDLIGLNVPRLRALFLEVFGHHTASNNGAWLRRKLAEPPDSLLGRGRSATIRKRDAGAAIWNSDPTRPPARALGPRPAPCQRAPGRLAGACTHGACADIAAAAGHGLTRRPAVRPMAVPLSCSGGQRALTQGRLCGRVRARSGRRRGRLLSPSAAAGSQPRPRRARSRRRRAARRRGTPTSRRAPRSAPGLPCSPSCRPRACMLGCAC